MLDAVEKFEYLISKFETIPNEQKRKNKNISPVVDGGEDEYYNGTTGLPVGLHY